MNGGKVRAFQVRYEVPDKSVDMLLRAAWGRRWFTYGPFIVLAIAGVLQAAAFAATGNGWFLAMMAMNTTVILACRSIEQSELEWLEAAREHVAGRA